MITDGIYPGVNFDTYAHGAEWEGRMNPGCIELAVRQTMAHVRADFLGLREREETQPLTFGSAAHCRMIEPDRFKLAYAMGEQCVAFTKYGKGPRCSKAGTGRFDGQWLCSSHAPDGVASKVERLTEKEAATIEGMRARILTHPAVNLLRQNGQAEVCIAWTCPRTGVKMKTRLDKFSPAVGNGLILDLKFIRSANPRDLANAIEEYGYARAGALRQDGIEVLTGKRPEYYLVCVEKDAPYEPVVPMMDDETMEGARWEVRGNLQLWANCVKTGKYPGYGDDFVEISAPAWKLQYYRTLKGGAQ